jgi:hypothetical protein
MKSKIAIIKPNILYFRILFKKKDKKDFLGLTTIKYLFKLALN